MAQEFAQVGRVGLWQESGAMQRHKFLGEAAEAPEITLTLALAIHPPILNKINFYLYRLIELAKRFKMIPFSFKYLKDK